MELQIKDRTPDLCSEMIHRRKTYLPTLGVAVVEEEEEESSGTLEDPEDVGTTLTMAT